MDEFSKGCYVAFSVSLLLAGVLEYIGYLTVNISALTGFLGL
ncbi:hypothetical protein HNP88_000834 [Methanococcus maripaludis]|uniref:Uncharacterized protein n=1 Tax=Methanococcus maripaludis TaxID=39152 RepID=A0A7J9NNM0_METMI|nr:hypothetical protein [Methanococcus maripaludis]MBA2846650.1 hypothetical protein [Methanococcus maripaludis]